MGQGHGIFFMFSTCVLVKGPLRGALRILKTTPEWSRMVVSVMNVPKEIGARIF